ncbi:response regulator [Merismopedia glauca]|uniref:Circadian input-output histidine kinase CikA n=1 Tax=Merismopedia glauca CCAP 1448/3 TaxID=1296344 RepID=A0A2T1BY56_9CYAN|nr:response regulator [Merismopedia glauca]PSB00966.1 hybrid sensor histidine kinase/response regulator [Merismopedia glauca CCAP 1448/3]
MNHQPESIRAFPASLPTKSEPQVNVLLVDDHPQNLVALEVVLQSLGQNLVKAQSGAAALKYLLHHDVAVILLDVQMPGIDGFETARLIRQRERSQHTPIIFLTAFAEGDDLRAQGYTLGAVDYLYKPIDPTILTSKVSVFIDLFKKNLEVQQQAAQLIAKNTEIVCAQAARQQAEEANRLKDEFLALISHELRTPLNSILGWSRLLLDRQFDAARTRRALETIERNAQTQAQLIEDILDISRLMLGKVELQIHKIDLTSFIDTTVDSIRPQAEAKSIHLSVQLDSTISTIEADPVRLRQIIWNLLANAIKFTPVGGKVSLQVSPSANDCLKLEISDTGIGIDPQFLPHIFDRFQQADSSSTRAHGGLGLGLAIVRQLVELHNGKIQVCSNGCNQGTTFTVQLAIANWHLESIGDLLPAVTTSSVRELPSLEGIQVLVVEDHLDNRELVQKVLEEVGASVIAVACAQAAISVLECIQPDVLVSDIAMPGEDGYQLIRQIRASKQSELPAIALTAHARPEDRRQALNAGFQEHISKPINAQQLTSVIAQLVAQFKSVTTKSGSGFKPD